MWRRFARSSWRPAADRVTVPRAAAAAAAVPIGAAGAFGSDSAAAAAGCDRRGPDPSYPVCNHLPGTCRRRPDSTRFLPPTASVVTERRGRGESRGDMRRMCGKLAASEPPPGPHAASGPLSPLPVPCGVCVMLAKISSHQAAADLLARCQPDVTDAPVSWPGWIRRCRVAAVGTGAGADRRVSGGSSPSSSCPREPRAVSVAPAAAERGPRSRSTVGAARSPRRPWDQLWDSVGGAAARPRRRAGRQVSL